MGNVQQCLGHACLDDDEDDRKHMVQRSKKRGEYSLLQWTQQDDIGCNLPTPPILNNQNEIIFLSTSNNSTTYTIYNLTQSEFTSNSEEIKCSETFDISNTVYTYNPNNNKIYFIENNKRLLSLEISKGEITSLNKSITTKNKNYATIHYNNNNIYIMGDESKSEPNNEYTIIPYSTIKTYIKKDKFKEWIENFGWHSRVINVSYDNKNCIFIAGGQKDFRKKESDRAVIRPNHALWTVELFDNNGKHTWNEIINKDNKKQQVTYYTKHPQLSFGIINYKNKYIILFGGVESKTGKIRQVSYIWLLCLCDKDKYKLKKYHWHELHCKLKSEGNYHAIYTELNGVETIHLFSYNGEYYTINMNDILTVLKKREYKLLQEWTQAGKTVLPTKSKSIENIGPKGNSEVDNMLDGLGKTYEQYKDKLKNKFVYLSDILNDNNNELAKLIGNADHRNRIIQAAQANN